MTDLGKIVLDAACDAIAKEWGIAETYYAIQFSAIYPKLVAKGYSKRSIGGAVAKLIADGYMISAESSYEGSEPIETFLTGKGWISWNKWKPEYYLEYDIVALDGTHGGNCDWLKDDVVAAKELFERSKTTVAVDAATIPNSGDTAARKIVMAKKPLDPSEILAKLKDEESKLFEEFENKMREKREKALAAVIDPLRTERATLCTTVNDANTRISEIDKELAKLTGKPVAAAKGGKGGTRVRRSAEQIADEMKQLATMGGKLYGQLKKAGKGEKVPVADLSANSLGMPVKKSLQPWIDAGLVGFHPNGPKPLYSYEKDGEPKAA